MLWLWHLFIWGTLPGYTQNEFPVPHEHPETTLIEIIAELENTYPVKFFFKPEEIPQTQIDTPDVKSGGLHELEELVKNLGLEMVNYDDHTIILTKPDFVAQNFTPDFYAVTHNFDSSLLQPSHIIDGVCNWRQCRRA